MLWRLLLILAEEQSLQEKPCTLSFDFFLLLITINVHVCFCHGLLVTMISLQ